MCLSVMVVIGEEFNERSTSWMLLTTAAAAEAAAAAAIALRRGYCLCAARELRIVRFVKLLKHFCHVNIR